MTNQLTWITDPHINFLGNTAQKAADSFVDHIGYEAKTLLITGDISEGHQLLQDLIALSQRFEHIYFILGNHDYYQSSFAQVKHDLVDSKLLPSNCTWLRYSAPVQLTPDVVLTGHDGFYDALEGNHASSRVVLNDFTRIEDLRVDYLTGNIVSCVRRIGAAWADEAETNLSAAIALNPKRIIFACHVPPFLEACMHRGEPSDVDYLPWYTNKYMGLMLEEKAEQHPGIDFAVYCGHTHSASVTPMLENLTVYSGSSAYRNPCISGQLDLTHD